MFRSAMQTGFCHQRRLCIRQQWLDSMEAAITYVEFGGIWDPAKAIETMTCTA